MAESWPIGRRTPQQQPGSTALPPAAAAPACGGAPPPGHAETLAGADENHQRHPRGRPAGSGRPSCSGASPEMGPRLMDWSSATPHYVTQSPGKTPDTPARVAPDSRHLE
ncbi:hypothetical protein GCM10027440_30910 [Nocardiopsis coralliicola]